MNAKTQTQPDIPLAAALNATRTIPPSIHANYGPGAFTLGQAVQLAEMLAKAASHKTHKEQVDAVLEVLLREEAIRIPGVDAVAYDASVETILSRTNGLKASIDTTHLEDWQLTEDLPPGWQLFDTLKIDGRRVSVYERPF